MSTQKQLDANRVNARKSTGPRTAEGKVASARNALQHGLRSRDVVLPGMEDPAQFQLLRQQFLDTIRPASAVETALVDQMAAAQWRLQRLRRIETALFTEFMENAADRLDLGPEDTEGPDEEAGKIRNLLLAHTARDLFTAPAQERLARYEAQLERSFDRAQRQLERLRKSAAANQPNEANSIPAATQPEPPAPSPNRTPAEWLMNAGERSSSSPLQDPWTPHRVRSQPAAHVQSAGISLAVPLTQGVSSPA